MEEINVKINIDNDEMQKLSDSIKIKITEFIGDSIAESVENYLDAYLEDKFNDKIMDWLDSTVDDQIEDKLGDKVESYMSYHFDMNDAIESSLGNINLEEYIDVNSVIDSQTITDVLENELFQYSPKNACALGTSFTDAVGKAILHQIESNSFVQKIQEALEKAIVNKYVDDIKTKAILDYESKLKEFVGANSNNNTYNNPFFISQQKSS